jgi:hypothetical protein
VILPPMFKSSLNRTLNRSMMWKKKKKSHADT